MEKHGHTTACSVKSHQYGWELVQRQDEKPEFVLPAGRRLSGESYCCLQLPDGRVLRTWSHSLPSSAQRCKQRQQTQAETCKISIKD